MATNLIGHKVVPGNVAQTAVRGRSDGGDRSALFGNGVEVCGGVERGGVARSGGSDRNQGGRQCDESSASHFYFLLCIQKRPNKRVTKCRG